MRVLQWTHDDETGEYTATTPDHILVAYRDEAGEWRWIAMLGDGTFEPAGDSGETPLADAQAAMDAAAAWSALVA